MARGVPTDALAYGVVLRPPARPHFPPYGVPRSWDRSHGFAAKGDPVFHVEGVALHSQKIGLKTATFEVVIEFLPDVIRQQPALGRPLRLEIGIVRFDKLIKKGSLLAMALVVRRTFAQAGFLAGRQLQHNRILAMRC